jgi:hypothetical protein
MTAAESQMVRSQVAGMSGCAKKEEGPAEAEPEPSRNQPTKIDKFENLMPGARDADQLGWGADVGTQNSAADGIFV